MAEKVDQMDPDEKIVEIAIERLRVFENHPFPAAHRLHIQSKLLRYQFGAIKMIIAGNDEDPRFFRKEFLQNLLRVLQIFQCGGRLILLVDSL